MRRLLPTSAAELRMCQARHLLIVPEPTDAIASCAGEGLDATAVKAVMLNGTSAVAILPQAAPTSARSFEDPEMAFAMSQRRWLSRAEGSDRKADWRRAAGELRRHEKLMRCFAAPLDHSPAGELC